MEKNKILIANLKMYMSSTDIKNYLDNIVGSVNNKNLIICPSSLYTPYFLKKDFMVGVQDISDHDTGAYTGSISAKQVASLKIKYTIVGHSERRKYHNETNTIIKNKLINALNNNIIPILCIGENEIEKNNNLTKEVLIKEIEEVFANIDKELLDNVIIAYEPIWAIGSGLTPTPEEVDNTIEFIKEYIKSNYYVNNKVIYGGSISTKNINEFNIMNNIDGYLVGSAAVDSNELLKLKEVVL